MLAGWSLSYIKVNFPYTQLDVERKFKNTPKNNKYNNNNIKNNEKEEKEMFSKGWVYQLQRTLMECLRVLDSDDSVLVILESRGVAYSAPTRDGTLSPSPLSLHPPSPPTPSLPFPPIAPFPLPLLSPLLSPSPSFPFRNRCSLQCPQEMAPHPLLPPPPFFSQFNNVI